MSRWHSLPSRSRGGRAPARSDRARTSLLGCAQPNRVQGRGTNDVRPCRGRHGRGRSSSLATPVCCGGARGTAQLALKQCGVVDFPGDVVTGPQERAASARSIPSPGQLADAVHDALAPYAWRGFTTTTVAALAVAAVDRARRAPEEPAGGRIYPIRLLRPASRDDERVDALALDLEVGQRWRGLTLREVSRRLVAGLTAADERNLWMDLELAWLLEPPA